MIYTLVIKEEASAEIKDAFTYYEEQVSELGFRFIQELEVHFNLIQKNPQHYSFFLNQKRFRSHSLERFPFSIIYEIIESEITVFAVHNHYKDSNTLLKKLP